MRRATTQTITIEFVMRPLSGSPEKIFSAFRGRVSCACSTASAPSPSGAAIRLPAPSTARQKKTQSLGKRAVKKLGLAGIRSRDRGAYKGGPETGQDEFVKFFTKSAERQFPAFSPDSGPRARFR
jgi:hypothetical protein